MLNLHATRDALRDSGLDTQLYTLKNAKVLGAVFIGIYSPEEYAIAVGIAEQEQIENNPLGRPKIFVPCSETVSAGMIEDCLIDPKRHQFFRGDRIAEFGIYGRARDAFLGRVIKDGRRHAGLVVLDVYGGVPADFIGLDGRSRLSRGVRGSYLASMKDQLGYAIEWVERSLCDEPSDGGALAGFEELHLSNSRTV